MLQAGRGAIVNMSSQVARVGRKGMSPAYNLGMGTPRDVAEAVLYLVSPAARWVSGTALHVTGGYQRPAPWL